MLLLKQDLGLTWFAVFFFSNSLVLLHFLFFLFFAVVFSSRNFFKGAEKFFDIKCRTSGCVPQCAVIVATVRAIKLHGKKRRRRRGGAEFRGKRRSRGRIGSDATTWVYARCNMF